MTDAARYQQLTDARLPIETRAVQERRSVSRFGKNHALTKSFSKRQPRSSTKNERQPSESRKNGH
jgi:hypothetical protein